jgi:hypothetical protein
MNHRTIFTPEAEKQLVALYNHIADAASPYIAARNTEVLVDYCDKLDLSLPFAESRTTMCELVYA